MSPRLDVATTAQTAAFLLVAILQCAIPVASGATEQAAPAKTVRKADPFATGTDEATIRLELARAEVAYGKDAPGVAALLRELSESLVNFERFAATEPHKRSARIAEAESLIRRALALDESNAGRGHPDVAHDLHILTRLLLLEWSVRNKFDRYAEAEAFARRALAIDDARSDDKDRDVARDLLTLENVLVAKQRWAEAEPLVRRALLIIEGLSGKAHPDTFPARNNLAQILTFLRRYEEAEELYKAALAHAEAACGKDQDSIATHLRNIIRCHSQTKRMADAEPFIRRIVAIDENAHDKNDRQYANDLRSLADSVIAAGRPLDAGQILRHALSVDEATYGRDNPIVVLSIKKLADLLENTERGNKAEPLRRRILAIYLSDIRKTKITTGHPYLHGALGNYRKLITRWENSEAFRPKLESLMHECALDDATKTAILKIAGLQ